MREIALGGERSFALTSQSNFSNKLFPSYKVHELEGESLRYRIEVEVSQKKLLPRIVNETFNVADHAKLFTSEHTSNE
jgi:hypothetical protein